MVRLIVLFNKTFAWLEDCHLPYSDEQIMDMLDTLCTDRHAYDWPNLSTRGKVAYVSNMSLREKISLDCRFDGAPWQYAHIYAAYLRVRMPYACGLCHNRFVCGVDMMLHREREGEH